MSYGGGRFRAVRETAHSYTKACARGVHAPQPSTTQSLNPRDAFGATQ